MAFGLEGSAVLIVLLVVVVVIGYMLYRDQQKKSDPIASVAEELYEIHDILVTQADSQQQVALAQNLQELDRAVAQKNLKTLEDVIMKLFTNAEAIMVPKIQAAQKSKNAAQSASLMAVYNTVTSLMIAIKEQFAALTPKH